MDQRIVDKRLSDSKLHTILNEVKQTLTHSNKIDITDPVCQEILVDLLINDTYVRDTFREAYVKRTAGRSR